MLHARTALPSTCTVHAPHIAMPQPNLVPVSPMPSRIAHRSGVSGSTSTSWRLPLTVSATIWKSLLRAGRAGLRPRLHDAVEFGLRDGRRLAILAGDVLTRRPRPRDERIVGHVLHDLADALSAVRLAVLEQPADLARR